MSGGDQSTAPATSITEPASMKEVPTYKITVEKVNWIPWAILAACVFLGVLVMGSS